MGVPDRDKFEALFGEHSGAIRAYALRRTDSAAAEDVVSDVFLVAWRRFDELPTEPRGWLFGVARRVLANQRRGRDRHAALIDELQAHAGTYRHHFTPALRSSSNDDYTDAIRAALASLSDTDRELLQLLAWEELTPTEIAAAMGIRLGTFTMRLARARRRFRAALDHAMSTRDSKPTTQIQAELEITNAT